MAKILLGITGSVAAIRTPALVKQLHSAGHQVHVVATKAALYFFDPVEIDEGVKGAGDALTAVFPHLGPVIRDEDEWPGRDSGRLYQRNDPVLHIELRRWANLLLVAPLDANTLAKLANGLSDNCLTCVWRAWDLSRPVILAPAMNTLMWENRLTLRHLRSIAGDAQPRSVPDLAHKALLDWINQNCPTLRVVPPVAKQLACGDMGMGGMAAVEEIVGAVANALTDSSGRAFPVEEKSSQAERPD